MLLFAVLQFVVLQALFVTRVICAWINWSMAEREDGTSIKKSFDGAFKDEPDVNELVIDYVD